MLQNVYEDTRYGNHKRVTKQHQRDIIDFFFTSFRLIQGGCSASISEEGLLRGHLFHNPSALCCQCQNTQSNESQEVQISNKHKIGFYVQSQRFSFCFTFSPCCLTSVGLWGRWLSEGNKPAVDKDKCPRSLVTAGIRKDDI